MEEIEINTEELDNLLVSYKNCADGKKKRVLHLNIVEKSMFLVKKIAMTLAFQFGMSTEDLIQVGSIGLIKAIEMYDCQKNTRFKTYASYFIRGEIRHYIRDKGPIIKAPREHRDMFLRVSAAIKALKEQGFDEPSEEQIANEAGLPLEKINEVLEIEHCRMILSLDQACFTDDDEYSLLDKIPSGDYREVLNSYEDKIMIVSAINKLPPKLKQIIEMSFFEDLNQREISERIHISQMQVSRRIKKALSKMYEIIKSSESSS